jgi:hypothetical protein
MAFGRVIRRTRKGDYALNLSAQERDVLRSLPVQLRELLSSDDPALRRLFPPAYPDDEALEAEYRGLMSADLLEHHTAALDTMETTIDNERLDEEQLLGWLGALNQLRLVLGTRLDVTEDMDYGAIVEDDPRHPAFAMYNYLTYLQGEVVEALSR